MYGFIGLQVVVPFVRSVFGGTGFGIFVRNFRSLRRLDLRR